MENDLWWTKSKTGNINYRLKIKLVTLSPPQKSKGFLSGGENPPNDTNADAGLRLTLRPHLPRTAASNKGRFEPLQRRELVTQNQTEKKKQEHKRRASLDERTKFRRKHTLTCLFLSDWGVSIPS